MDGSVVWLVRGFGLLGLLFLIWLLGLQGLLHVAGLHRSVLIWLLGVLVDFVLFYVVDAVQCLLPFSDVLLLAFCDLRRHEHMRCRQLGFWRVGLYVVEYYWIRHGDIRGVIIDESKGFLRVFSDQLSLLDLGVKRVLHITLTRRLCKFLYLLSIARRRFRRKTRTLQLLGVNRLNIILRDSPGQGLVLYQTFL